MNLDQLRKLSKIKKLIIKGKRRFAIRKDRDYIQELLEIGLSEEEAWNEILTLSNVNYCIDYKPTYYKNNDALIFKKEINKKIIYIKLKIEKCKDEEISVCLSFHIDHK